MIRISRIAPGIVAVAWVSLALAAGPAVAEAEEGEPDATSGSPPAPAPTPAATPAAPAPVESRPYLLDRLAAGASLGYFSADDSQILSNLHFDFPFLVIRQKSIYVRGGLETSTVRQAGQRGTDAFRAQNLEYLVEAGIRDFLSNRIAIAAFYGLQGGHQLDGGGSPDRPPTASVQYAGFGIESAGFPKPGAARLEWRVAVAPTFANVDVEGDAIVRGAIIYELLRLEKSSVAIEGSFDSLFDGTTGQTEYRIGPSWNFPLANGVRASLFGQWIRGKNPLLLFNQQGWNFGVRYTEGAYTGPHTLRLPDVRGVLAFGLGEDRGFGRFDLDLASPEFRIFSRPTSIAGELDANLVSGSGIDTLYYIATLGLEMEVMPRLVSGVRLYHRSNHTLDDPVVPTSLNIVGLFAQTPGWEYGDRLPGRLYPQEGYKWYDRIEGMIAPGIVTGSTFSDAQSWDLQAGIRFDILPRSQALVPFVSGFAEWGEVTRREASVGFTTPQNLVIELEYRRDSQYFGDDQEDVFLGASLYF